MIELVCTRKNLPYAGRTLTVGDHFEAIEADAKILRLAGYAMLKSEQEAGLEPFQAQTKAFVEQPPEPRKRKYVRSGKYAKGKA